jgi:precorrin-2 dehydrogenase/sirohydrochlorin ferrochelatase
MGYVPLFMAVTDQPCVVIGGGAIAEQRVRTLLAASALVTVISDSLTPGLHIMAANGTIQYRARALAAGDLIGFRLVYCVDPDPTIAACAVAEARNLGLPINVTDRPELCSFIVPAMVKRGHLQIAVSTSGASPALARILRQELAECFGPSYELLLTVLTGARQYLRDHEPDPARRAALSHALARALRDPLTHDDYAAAEAALRRCIGVGLADLGIDPTPRSVVTTLPVTPGSA